MARLAMKWDGNPNANATTKDGHFATKFNLVGVLLRENLKFKFDIKSNCLGVSSSLLYIKISTGN